MFSTKTFIALLVFAAPFLVRADVDPTVPAPGAIYNEGSPCPIAWIGDTNSTTNWKNMAIELMAGNNLEMEFITTVATGQDGTVSGQFSYPCPKVTPNAAIYFYQFTSAATQNIRWTGRFTIASSTGIFSLPANSEQPDGSNIPWGNGSLVNPSDVVPPPSFASSTVSLSSSIASNISSSSTPVVASSITGSAPPVITDVATSASSVIPLSASASPSAQTSNTSGAVTGVDLRVLSAAAAAAATLALSFVW